MTQLKGHLPPLRTLQFHDLMDYRRPPLTPQIGWMKRAAKTERYQERIMFLKYTNFKLVCRQADGGPAELIRLVLTFGGIPFKQEVIPEVDWKALIQKTPHGSLPVLWIDNCPYGEINAIVRHMASQVGLLGDDHQETLVIETVLLQVERMRDSDVIQKAFEELVASRPDDNAEAFLEVLLPANFKYWNEKIGKTAGPYLVGSGISVADLAIYDFVTQHRQFFPLDAELNKYRRVRFLCAVVPKNGRLNSYKLVE